MDRSNAREGHEWAVAPVNKYGKNSWRCKKCGAVDFLSYGKGVPSPWKLINGRTCPENVIRKIMKS